MASRLTWPHQFKPNQAKRIEIEFPKVLIDFNTFKTFFSLKTEWKSKENSSIFAGFNTKMGATINIIEGRVCVARYLQRGKKVFTPTQNGSILHSRHVYLLLPKSMLYSPVRTSKFIPPPWNKVRRGGGGVVELMEITLLIVRLWSLFFFHNHFCRAINQHAQRS